MRSPLVGETWRDEARGLDVEIIGYGNGRGAEANWVRYRYMDEPEDESSIMERAHVRWTEDFLDRFSFREEYKGQGPRILGITSVDGKTETARVGPVGLERKHGWLDRLTGW